MSATVWVGAPHRRGHGGRWHHVFDCPYLLTDRAHPLREIALADAVAAQRHECPYCCPPPPCCATGDHSGVHRWERVQRVADAP